MKMNKKLLFYGVLLALLTGVLQVAKYQYVWVNNDAELYAGVVAIIFVVLGLVMGRKLTRPKEVIIEKTVLVTPEPVAILPPEQQLEKLGLSKREFEILQLMSLGMSNQEIADKTFVSLNTVKTHVSNILLKLDAKRRTQAVLKAKELKLVS